jgi:hypothetical protein
MGDLLQWRNLANNGMAHLTGDEVKRMVAKPSGAVGPGLALKLDIIGRHKIIRDAKAARDEGVDRLRKQQRRGALAEFGPEYFMELKRTTQTAQTASSVDRSTPLGGGPQYAEAWRAYDRRHGVRGAAP